MVSSDGGLRRMVGWAGRRKEGVDGVDEAEACGAGDGDAGGDDMQVIVSCEGTQVVER